MFKRMPLNYVAGAIALALSAHGYAQTTTVGTGSTLIFTENDTTTGSGYVYDLNLNVAGSSAFTGTSNETFNISSLSTSGAYSSFLSSVGSTDSVEWSVAGGEEPSASTAPVTVDVTSSSGAPTLKTNAAIASAYGRVNTFLGTISNPSGSDSFQSASAATGWFASGGENGLNGNLGINDSAAVGSSLSFYQLVGSAVSGHTAGTVADFGGGTWSFANNVLTYTAAPVPLPAPLLLLLSGLGLTGLIGRRRNASDSSLGGAAA